MRVIVTGARTPFALHMSRLLHSAGHDVLLTDSQRFSIARFTRFKQRFALSPSARYDTARYITHIRTLARDWQADVILPTCEEIFYLSHGLAGTPERARLFAPDFEQLAEVHDKARFAELAVTLGAGPEQNIVLRSPEDVVAFAPEPNGFVFKPVWSRFASRVLVSPSREELMKITPTPDAPWLAQTRVVGEEFCVYAVAHRGRLVAASPYRNLMRAGVGTAICYESTDAPDIVDFVRRFVEHMNWHGQVSFDFIRTAEGRLVAIECNPRATSGLSLFGPKDGLPDAIFAGKPANMPSRGRLGLLATMLMVGSFGTVGILRRQKWVPYILSSHDSMAFPGEWNLFHGQILSIAELAWLGLRQKRSILEATTHDMAWDGEPINSGAPVDLALSRS